MAKPETGPDGSVNLMVWHCTIPGKAGVSIQSCINLSFASAYVRQLFVKLGFLNFLMGILYHLLLCLQSSKLSPVRDSCSNFSYMLYSLAYSYNYGRLYFVRVAVWYLYL